MLTFTYHNIHLYNLIVLHYNNIQPNFALFSCPHHTKWQFYSHLDRQCFSVGHDLGLFVSYLCYMKGKYHKNVISIINIYDSFLADTPVARLCHFAAFLRLLDWRACLLACLSCILYNCRYFNLFLLLGVKQFY